MHKKVLILNQSRPNSLGSFKTKDEQRFAVQNRYPLALASGCRRTAVAIQDFNSCVEKFVEKQPLALLITCETKRLSLFAPR
jgi:hypothetical protein